MTEEARAEWLAVAYATVGHLPSDLLAAGCAKARQTADHPSKIVPAIIAETEGLLSRRRRFQAEYGQAALPAPTRRSVMDRRGEAMTEDDTAELNRILENLGATARYRSDGSRYTIEPVSGGR